MARPFTPSDAERFLDRLRNELEREPSMSNPELATRVDASLPTVRKYRKMLQGRSFPPRRRTRFVSAEGIRPGRPRRCRIPRPYSTVVVAPLPFPPSEEPLGRGFERVRQLDAGGNALASSIDSTLQGIEERSRRTEELLARIELGFNERERGFDATLARIERLVTPPPLSDSDQRWRKFQRRLEIPAMISSLRANPAFREVSELVRWWWLRNLLDDLDDDSCGKPVSELCPIPSLLVWLPPGK